jgi:NAD(P)-dependent dehydrogenase (short-subunit alcohol dehydrogenase family)
MKKTILITGSTDGIGKLAALKMAHEGHKLYLHGRYADKLSRVIAEVKTATGNDQIDGFNADFSDLDAVRQLSQEINTRLSTIDVLINNAGIFKSAQHLTEHGIDIRMVVNYYAPYLLTNSIIDKLRASSAGRLVNLSSAAQSSVSMQLLDGSTRISDQEAYAQSKLAILMWSFHLAQQEPDIAVVALNPGSLLNTNMVRGAYGKFWSPAEKGADIIYDMALVNSPESIDGKYYDNDRGDSGEAHPDAYDRNRIQELIEKTDFELNQMIS